MATQFQPARGTKDIASPESDLFRHINSTAFNWAQKYGYGEIHTPIFEATQVFQKTLGDTSDIVGKEMYTFEDRGGDSITLRPEGTAGIARAFISNGWTQNLPLKLFYFGPMFRYERPQKGRYRQFHQLGVESLGQESPLADIECLSLGWDILSALGLQQKVQLEINTLGDSDSRLHYREQVVQYFEKYKNDLSKDSLERLSKNPLRILDSKDEGDKKLIPGAPSMQASMNDRSRAFFDKVLSGLGQLNIPVKLNQTLVRGLDYYCHTVFEFTTTHLGAQSAVLAGGRYDGLIAQMGGPQTPGVGWASGVERLALLLEENLQVPKPKTIAVLAAEESTELWALSWAQKLRAAGYIVEMPTSGNLGKKFKRADKVQAEYALVLGSSEKLQNSVTVKNLKSGEQKLIAESELLNQIK